MMEAKCLPAWGQDLYEVVDEGASIDKPHADGQLTEALEGRQRHC
jgi:hypothetical protein